MSLIKLFYLMIMIPLFLTDVIHYHYYINDQHKGFYSPEAENCIAEKCASLRTGKFSCYRDCAREYPKESNDEIFVICYSIYRAEKTSRNNCLNHASSLHIKSFNSTGLSGFLSFHDMSTLIFQNYLLIIQ